MGAGLGKLAAEYVKDSKEAFDMALECKNMEAAFEFCEKLKRPDCWRRLAAQALGRGEFPLYEAALIQLKELEKLSYLYLLQGNRDKLGKMLAKSKKRADLPSRLNNAMMCGDVGEQVQVLSECGCKGLAYLLARCSRVDAGLVEQLAGQVDADKLGQWVGDRPLDGLQPVNPDDGAWPVEEYMDQGDIVLEIIKK